MSCSTLYLLDKDMKIQETEDFDNAWFMSPKIWEHLHNKHYNTPFNMCLITEKSIEELEEKILESKVTEDALLYFISYQQIISLSHKEEILKLLKKFVINPNILNPLASRIWDLILELQTTNANYFIWKNTSCDDGVEIRFNNKEVLKNKFKGERIICEFDGSKFKWLKWK